MITLAPPLSHLTRAELLAFVAALAKAAAREDDAREQEALKSKK